MPAVYAHYRMGMALLPTMPADVRRTIQRFRRLFDVGLHGPDILFYLNPIIRTNVGALGSKFHSQTGREFFQRTCRIARLEKSEAAQAYLYGVLCHYVLDSACHPFVIGQVARGVAVHTRIEAEFDRFLLETDGKLPPEAQDLSGHLQLTYGECETVAKFYPGITTRNVQDCIRNMTAVLKLFATPDGARRTVLRKGLSLFGPRAKGLLTPTAPDPVCRRLDRPLLELYDKAIADFPIYLNQLQAHLTYNGLFEEEFTKTFC